MKRIIVLLQVAVIAVFLTGCAHNTYEKDKNISRQKLPNISIDNGNGHNVSDIELYAIDSCEYIGKLQNQSYDWAAHKGNCKFCRERRKQEIKEAIKEYFEGR